MIRHHRRRSTIAIVLEFLHDGLYACVKAVIGSTWKLRGINAGRLTSTQVAVALLRRASVSATETVMEI